MRGQRLAEGLSHLSGVKATGSDRRMAPSSNCSRGAIFKIMGRHLFLLVAVGCVSQWLVEGLEHSRTARNVRAY